MVQWLLLMALPSLKQDSTLTGTLNLARSSALAPSEASQKMTMVKSSDSTAQMLYAPRADATFSVMSV